MDRYRLTIGNASVPTFVLLGKWQEAKKVNKIKKKMNEEKWPSGLSIKKSLLFRVSVPAERGKKGKSVAKIRKPPQCKADKQMAERTG